MLNTKPLKICQFEGNLGAAHCYTVPEYSESGEGFAAEPPKNWSEGVKKKTTKNISMQEFLVFVVGGGGGGGWGGT